MKHRKSTYKYMVVILSVISIMTLLYNRSAQKLNTHYTPIAEAQQSHTSTQSQATLLTGWYDAERDHDMQLAQKQYDKEYEHIVNTSKKMAKERQLERETLEQEKLEQEKLEQEKLEQEKLEQEKLEQKKLEQEKLQQEKLKQEKLEQEKLKQEKSSHSNATTNNQSANNQNTSSQKPVQQAPQKPVQQAPQKPVQQAPQKPVQQAPQAPQAKPNTNGFSFKGHHFPLSTFSGGGKVPIHTPYVFQWVDVPNHYLIERVSPAGNVITSVGLGDTITIRGQSYRVTAIERNVQNTTTAIDMLEKHPASVTFQTCQTNIDSQGYAYLTIWYAQPI